MASKHAALYFEAYKQHHLVCSSLHTLSVARCPEFKVAVVMDERIPASSTSSESEAKRMCDKAEPREMQDDNRLKTDNADVLYCPNGSLLYRTVLQVLALLQNDWYWASPMAVDCGTDKRLWTPTYTSWISCTQARTHANDQ